MGHTPPAASSDTTNVIVNETEMASTSAGERIRRRYQKKSVSDEEETWMADYEDCHAEEAGEGAAGSYGGDASGWSGGAVRDLYGEMTPSTTPIPKTVSSAGERLEAERREVERREAAARKRPAAGRPSSVPEIQRLRRDRVGEEPQ